MRLPADIRWLVGIVLVAGWAVSPSVVQSRPGDLRAIVPPDNDLSLDELPAGRRMAVPPTVGAKIRAIVDGQRHRWRVSLKDDLPRGWDFYSPVFRISAPEKRELYIFNLIGPLGFRTYYLTLFDPRNSAVTARPVVVFAKWTQLMGMLLTRPLISFEDIDGDGRPELVVEEAVHNGTVYNAVVYHYFHVGADLSLTRILALEARVIDIESPNEEDFILRTLTANSPAEMLLQVWRQRSESGPREKVGECVLRRTVIGMPFRVAERRAVRPQDESFLITASGQDDDDFLANGHTFWY